MKMTMFRRTSTASSCFGVRCDRVELHCRRWRRIPLHHRRRARAVHYGRGGPGGMGGHQLELLTKKLNLTPTR